MKALGSPGKLLQAHSGSGAANRRGRHGIEHIKGGIVGHLHRHAVDQQAPGGKIHPTAQEVRLMGAIAAVLAAEQPQVVVVIEGVAHPVEAAGADPAVMGAADAGIGAAHGFIHGKVNTLVAAVRQLLADRLVGVEDQRAVRALCDGGSHLFQHQVRVAVADDLVAQQVQHQIVVRRHIGKDKAGVALIHFQHDVIRPEPSAQRCPAQQGGGNAGSQVGALFIIDDRIALLPQDMGDQVGGRGLAVGTGDRNDFAVIAQLPQHGGIQL